MAVRDKDTSAVATRNPVHAWTSEALRVPPGLAIVATPVLSAQGERSARWRGIVHRFPGGTKEQYEASIAAVHPSDGSLPEGQIFHVAGPSADGWTIVAIHESQESWERFRNETLMPTMSEGIEGGFPTPPEETTFRFTTSRPVRRTPNAAFWSTAPRKGLRQARPRQVGSSFFPCAGRRSGR